MNTLSKLPRLLLFVGILFTSNHSFAEDVNAKQQLQIKLAALKTYEANFTQTVVDFEGTILQQASGKIVLQQPNKLYWELFEPNESVLLADGDNIWNIDPFLEQVSVSGADAALENNPLILLTNPNSSKWQEFNVRQMDNQFVITPVEANGGIELLRLVFNDDKLIELESQDGQQQKSVLSFSQIKQNHSLPADTFKFVMPDGYELDDLR